MFEELDINLKNKVNFTALHIAAKAGYEAIVSKLLEKDAHVNVLDSEGRSPLSYASENGHLEIINSLLKKGASWGTDPSKFIINIQSTGSDSVSQKEQNINHLLIKNQYQRGY